MASRSTSLRLCLCPASSLASGSVPLPMVPLGVPLVGISGQSCLNPCLLLCFPYKGVTASSAMGWVGVKILQVCVPRPAARESFRGVHQWDSEGAKALVTSSPDQRQACQLLLAHTSLFSGPCCHPCAGSVPAS